MENNNLRHIRFFIKKHQVPGCPHLTLLNIPTQKQQSILEPPAMVHQ